MKWTYKWDGKDVIIYDHNGEQVTTAINSDPPSKTISPNGIPTDPNVRATITDYLTDEIENETWPSTDAKETYIRTAQTILAAGQIEERE